MTSAKIHRIRDPIHNLIEFGAEPATRDIEEPLWECIQTPAFQRLRRIKQLGFSELVFPGATHTRFAHSLGVFHTARLLFGAIGRSMSSSGDVFKGVRVQQALAAALLHDIGHGMFSHAFEAVGKTLKLPMARHERVSDMLIRDSEITRILDDGLTTGFSTGVADLIGREQPKDFYDAVVTSQFDADRLDYMQRDRLMTGLHSGTVDVTWLLNNLEVASIPASVDNEQVRPIQTLVLGPKAFHVAESYVVALFHLYPNVYLHKATRGAEMVLKNMILRLFVLRDEGRLLASGLPSNHPILRFVSEPHDLIRAQALDDTVLWGALSMLAEAEDAQIKLRAAQLKDRRLLACYDIRSRIATALAPKGKEHEAARKARMARIDLACNRVLARQEELPDAMFDTDERNPYKRVQDSRTPPNQIHIMQHGSPRDMAELSSIVGSAEPFRIFCAYHSRSDKVTADKLGTMVREECERVAGTDCLPLNEE